VRCGHDGPQSSLIHCDCRVNDRLGEHTLREEAFAEALTIANALGGLSTRVQLEVNSASLQLEKRDFDEAKRRCDRAMALAGHLDDVRANGEASKVYGIIARETGDLVGAEMHLTAARDVATAAKDLALEGDTNRELAELYGRLGRNRETLQALNRALEGIAGYMQPGKRGPTLDLETCKERNQPSSGPKTKAPARFFARSIAPCSSTRRRSCSLAAARPS